MISSQKNILIFADGAHRRTAKLSDFGYSSFIPFPEQRHLAYMPKSVPWTAPEYHHCGFTFNEAVKMDIYSFGLFAFWFLLEVADEPKTCIFQEDGAEGDPRTITELAKRLLRARVPRDPIIEAKVGQLFDLSLAYYPDQRARSMTEIIIALEPQW